MIRNNISMTIKTLKAMKDNPSKDTIDFNSPIQRKSGMWDDKRKSLLIHSILQNSIYSVPTVYFRKDMVADKKYQYSVIDGIQRITTVFDFIDNKFPLTEVPPVVIEGTAYNVSGQYFSDLEQDCQQELIRFKLRIEAFEPEDGDTEEYVNNTIEEVFSRLNSAVPLTSAQLCKAKAGTDVAILLNELLTSHFFAESASFTKAQLKTSDDQRCLLQAMMLLDRNYVAGFEFRDISETSLMEYAESIKGCYTDKQSNLLRSAVQYLTEAFPVKDKQLKKINIPMLIYLADVAEDAEIRPMLFRQWWEFFTEEDALFEDYKLFCSSGSTKLEKVNGRLAVMVKSFSAYHEIEIPEELKDMAAEVEEKITAIKTENLESVSVGSDTMLEEKEGGDVPDTGDIEQEDTVAESTQKEQDMLELGKADSEEQEEASDVQKDAETLMEQEPAPDIKEVDAGHCEDEPEPPDTGESGAPVDAEE